jgi:GDPmannose 4,6-dehydratase
MAFKSINIQLKWEGEDENEVGINIETGSVLIKINPKFYRPAEVELLIGDPTKAKNILNWEAKTTLEELCEMMVKSDIERNKNGGTF